MKKMFNSKQKTLLKKKSTQKTSVTNPFIQAGLKKSAETVSANGAKKYSTTGNAFVDQFGKTSSYKPKWNKSKNDIDGRSFDDIAADCETLWGTDIQLSVMFIFFLRMISRKVTLWDGTQTKEPQRGAEAIYEGIMRAIWLQIKSPETWWKNAALWPSIGSWKDIFQMLTFDLEYHGWENRVLDWDKYKTLILSGLEEPNQRELILKYLPTIKSNNKCKTTRAQARNIIGKWLAHALFAKEEDTFHPEAEDKMKAKRYKAYRKLKSSGTAHEWQQLISRKEFDRIDFSKIHGRALNKLVRSKFLDNQKQRERFTEWSTDDSVETIKYTGYVHELLGELPRHAHYIPAGDKAMIDKQFLELVQKTTSSMMEEGACKYIGVVDTSGSMGSPAQGTNIPCGNVALSLALFMSYFLKGEFANSWIDFNRKAEMHVWTGNTPVEKYCNARGSGYISNTDFQTVITLLCDIKRQGVDEADFPEGIVCFSDGEFDADELGKTNVESARDRLRAAGFSEEYCSNFKIVLWNLRNNYYGSKSGSGENFETFGDVPNVFYASGYSASLAAFLIEGKPIQTAADLFHTAMDQEVLRMIEV
jgi:hypothetical protein